MEGPMRARVEEYDDLQRCIDTCFPTETAAGGMAARWPHCLQRTPERVGRYRVIKDGGRIVACLACIEQTASVDGGLLRMGGIGQVSTLPEYRGQGLMSRLLDDAIRRMEEEGIALSDLGGDRLRYGRYGWETAGREWTFTVTPRSIGAAARPQGFEARRIEASGAAVAGIMRLHDAEPRRTVRTEAGYRVLLSRLGKELWGAYAGGELRAYAVTQMQRTPPAVYEFGGGDEALHALLGEIVATGTSAWQVWSPWEHAANGRLVSLAAGWSVTPLRMMRIVDLPATLKAFSGQMTARCRRLGRAPGGRVRLRLADSGQSATLCFDRDGVMVEGVSGGGAEVALPAREMVRFLFGPGTPEAGGVAAGTPPLLAGVLPLDFGLWHNDMV